jgi:hypothetical protein
MQPDGDCPSHDRYSLMWLIIVSRTRGPWLGSRTRARSAQAPHHKETAIVRLLVVTAMLAYAILQWCVHDVVASGELMPLSSYAKARTVLFHFAGRIRCTPGWGSSLYPYTLLLKN